MSEQNVVEVTIKVPENAIKALKEYVLPRVQVSEGEYWKENAVGCIVADMEFFANCEDEDLMTILDEYSLMKYY